VVPKVYSSIKEAIKNALTKTAKTVHNMRWYVVTETRGYIENDVVAYHQVTIKIDFTLED